MPLFTVFTPAYNRAHTLHRVYDSLLKQTCHDFEWLIVDDGSTDHTADLVKQWQAVAPFALRYVWQPNGHKKSAFNRGVVLAQGVLFLTVDSDDEFVPEALERFAWHWASIVPEQRAQFVGVTALSRTPAGAVIGSRFPTDTVLDSDAVELFHRYRVKGDKWGFSRTDVLRQYPFPEGMAGHVPESVVWAAIARHYRTRYINEPLLIVHYDAGDRLTDGYDFRQGAAGMVHWKCQVLSEEMGWFPANPVYFLLEGARLTRFRLHLHSAAGHRSTEWPTGAGFWLALLMMPVGWAWWCLDVIKQRSRKMGKV